MSQLQLVIALVAIIFIVVGYHKSEHPSAGIVIIEYRSIEPIVTVDDVERLLLAEYYALEAQEALVRNEYRTEPLPLTKAECAKADRLLWESSDNCTRTYELYNGEEQAGRRQAEIEEELARGTDDGSLGDLDDSHPF